MILIADSGSTKTDWRIINDKKTVSTDVTIGFNPYFSSTETIVKEIQKNLTDKLSSASVDQIYFYGAGCSSEDQISIVRKALHEIFPNAGIEIHHDLLAAARALCGTEAGIACILGTGSNSCYYDGTDILNNIPSLGFILGDEGSGAHMGKKLLQNFFYKNLEKVLEEKMEFDLRVTKENVLNALYNEKLPNKYLASFSPFLLSHIEYPSVKKIVIESFIEFYNNHISNYVEHTSFPVHFTGSVAYHFQDILRTVMQEKGLKVGSIIKKPIDSLVNYHIN